MKPMAVSEQVAGPAQPYVASLPRQPWRGFAAVLCVNAALSLLLLYLDQFRGVDHWNLVRDTNAIAGQPAYFGFYSNLGVLAWTIGGTIALFAWLVLRTRMEGDVRLRVLRLGGLFAAAAGLDDLFMLHENSYVIGISDKVVMAAYVLFLLAFAASTLPILHRTKWILLVGALGALACAFMLDLTRFPGSVLMEEVSKLTGISLLAAYLATLAWSALSEPWTEDGRALRTVSRR